MRTCIQRSAEGARGTSPLFTGDLLPGRYATWEVDKRGGRSPQKGGEEVLLTGGCRWRMLGGGGYKSWVEEGSDRGEEEG